MIMHVLLHSNAALSRAHIHSLFPCVAAGLPPQHSRGHAEDQHAEDHNVEMGGDDDMPTGGLEGAPSKPPHRANNKGHSHNDLLTTFKLLADLAINKRCAGEAFPFLARFLANL